MILIFSERENLSTRFVLAYLQKFQAEFEVFLEDDLIEFEYVYWQNQKKVQVFKNKSYLIDLDKIHSVWYYRTDIRVKRLGDGKFDGDEDAIEYNLWHVKTRYSSIANLLHEKRCLGVFGKGNFNKIEFLDNCTKLGIRIPNTLITDKKSELKAFLSYNKGEIITKSLAYPFREVSEDNNKCTVRQSYTTLLTIDEISNLPELFELSLFQEKVDKSYEIRVFYIDGECFSQALFSQMNEKSSLDYRLGYETSMRCCNIKLPNIIEEQVDDLMKLCGLNIGSLDIIYTKQNEYLFLEVNPSGQFGAVTEIINGQFEYRIAKFLLN